MKYSKNVQFEYEANGICEENGWIKWYNKETVGKKLRLTGTYSQAFMVAAMVTVSRIFTDEIETFGILKLTGFLAVNAIILLIIVAPIRGIFHLIPVSKGKLDANCTLCFRKHFSAYNGNLNRTQILISLVIPIVFFALIFGISAVLTNGITRFFMIFILVESCFMCSYDVYMFFFCIKNIGKSETVFGEYKKP